MAKFVLTKGDTLPALQVTLADSNGVYNLTGATSVTLRIKLSNGAFLTRNMTIVSPSAGIVRYSWVSGDWDDGNLIPSPSMSPAPNEDQHRMDYHVIGPGSVRVTFPNGTYDTLLIRGTLG